MRPLLNASLLKLPLLTLLCTVSVSVALSRSAIAGSRGVTLPESGSAGVADTFAPGSAAPDPNINPNQLLSSRIYDGLLNSLENILQRESAVSLGDQTVPISPAQVDTLAALFLDGQPTSATIAQLEQQLAAEMGGQVISLSPLGNTPSDLQTAINSANGLIMNLSSEQLAAALESPTFLAILEVLEDGGDSLENNRSDARLSRESSSDFSVINMTLAEVVVPEPVQRQPQPLPRVEPPAPPQAQPRTEPSFQEPIRGLW